MIGSPPMRFPLILPALAGLTLAACYQLGIGTPEEVRACRVFTQAQLRSPSTYSEVSSNSFDRPVTEAELRQRYAAEREDEMGRLLLSVAHGHQLQLRTVMLEHDAANAYGTPIRGTGLCEFLLIDGRIWGTGSLESRARTAASMIQSRQLAETLNNRELRDLVRRHGDGLDCCVR